MTSLVWCKFSERTLTGLHLLLTSAILQLVAPAIAGQSGQMATYDVPEQSLASALEIFAQVSGHEVLYDGRLTDGRRSSLVRGSYPAETALQIMLAGSGLRADVRDERFFLLSPAVAAQDHAQRGGPETARYYGALQAGIKHALCEARSLPDDGRLAARLWFGEDGAVLQVRLLGAKQSAPDERILAALRRLHVGTPPPGFAQPVTIVVRPRAAAEADACPPSLSRTGSTP